MVATLGAGSDLTDKYGQYGGANPTKPYIFGGKT
jgi:hypothetical protein